MAHDHMSDLEAMMWNVEQDPWLAPNGGSITVYDRELDLDVFRRSVRRAVVDLPRLRQCVAPGLGPLSTPRWVHDHRFDLDWHVRRIGAPGDGSLRALLDHFGTWLQDPYDRSRPLWMYVVVDGLEGGRGALLSKVHHSVADGERLVEMSRAYTSTERDAPPPPDVNLEAVIEQAPDDRVDFAATAWDAANEVVRRGTGLGRRLLRGVLHPSDAAQAGSDGADLVKTANEQLQPAGSELWSTRSRRRQVDAFSLPFAPVRESAHALGGTINDFFLAGAVEAAIRYHRDVDAPLDRLHLTLVVNTHTGDDSEGNAFSPIPIEVSAGPMTLSERFADIHALVRSKRGEVHGSGPMAAMAPIMNLLPIPLMTSLARDQASHIDFATSNLPGFRHDTYVTGAKTLHTYPFGPVAGTAFNLTMMSTADVLDVGLNVDPAAVTEPRRLTDTLRRAYDDLLNLD